MKVIVHFDSAGRILSVAKVEHMANAAQHPFLHVDTPDQVLVLDDKPAEWAGLQAHEIADQYVVEIKERRLKKKSLGGSRTGGAKKKARKTVPNKRG